VIKDQMQLFRNVYPVLADKVQEEMANSEPPKPEPKPATV
jgi:catalase